MFRLLGGFGEVLVPLLAFILINVEGVSVTVLVALLSTIKILATACTNLQDFTLFVCPETEEGVEEVDTPHDVEECDGVEGGDTTTAEGGGSGVVSGSENYLHPFTDPRPSEHKDPDPRRGEGVAKYFSNDESYPLLPDDTLENT